MRLFLLPISTRRALIYCEPLARTVPVAQQSYLDRIVNKANETWLGWEKDDKAVFNWKQRTTNYGNLLFRRIPFEEWGLKTIPPMKKGEPAASSPDTSATPVSGARAARDKRIEVNFPSLYHSLCTRDAQETLKRIATDRQSLHRTKMYWSLVGMPMSIPFALVPVIPNLPFFYLLFRFYSHWKALSGSKHLDSLIRNDHIYMKPSPTLDTLYTAGLLHPTRIASRGAPEPTLDQSRAVVQQLSKQAVPDAAATASSSSASSSSSSSGTEKPPPAAADEEVMLLRGWNGKLIAERLGLPGLEVEIERAVEQVEKGIGKSAAELAQEKAELEALAQKSAK